MVFDDVPNYARVKPIEYYVDDYRHNSITDSLDKRHAVSGTTEQIGHVRHGRIHSHQIVYPRKLYRWTKTNDRRVHDCGDRCEYRRGRKKFGDHQVEFPTGPQEFNDGRVIENSRVDVGVPQYAGQHLHQAVAGGREFRVRFQPGNVDVR